MYEIISMDGQGNVDFRDGQTFSTKEVAERIAAGLNHEAELTGSDWYYMATPAMPS